jgi:hypothetical protein
LWGNKDITPCLRIWGSPIISLGFAQQRSHLPLGKALSMSLMAQHLKPVEWKLSLK